VAPRVSGTISGSIGAAPPAVGRPLLEIGRAHADFAPVLTGKDPIFILLLGGDARKSQPLERSRADSIHVLGINPEERRATLYGIPRDSWVPLASGGTNKINSAMQAGGPQAQIETVERLTGITFDYYVLTGFDELIAAVNQVGGIKIDIPHTFQGYTQTFEAGPDKLDGRDALEFARERYSLQTGDFERSMNQGWLLLAALETFQKAYGNDPSTLFTWLGAGVRNVRTDLSLDELMTLGFTAASVKPKRITNLVALGSSATVGGTSAVTLSSANGSLWRDLAADGYITKKDVPSAAQPG
jgi:polyisoprenyl-teichoic acid--peptidoglycan teichoic acid transferase